MSEHASWFEHGGDIYVDAWRFTDPSSLETEISVRGWDRRTGEYTYAKKKFGYGSGSAPSNWIAYAKKLVRKRRRE